MAKEKHELDLKPVELMLVGEVSSDSRWDHDGSIDLPCQFDRV